MNCSVAGQRHSRRTARQRRRVVMSLAPVEVACEFVPMRTANNLGEARALSRDLVAAHLPAFVIKPEGWEAISLEAGPGQDIPNELFRAALGGTVRTDDVKYSFTGQRPCDAHVDEVPENLLGLRRRGMLKINIHDGRSHSQYVHARPGYYEQDARSRNPVTGFNFGITEDLLRGRNLDPVHKTEPQIHEARLTGGDRVVFFERTSETVDGLPNVEHLFHRGTLDRYSEITHHYSPVA